MCALIAYTLLAPLTYSSSSLARRSIGPRPDIHTAAVMTVNDRIIRDNGSVRKAAGKRCPGVTVQPHSLALIIREGLSALGAHCVKTTSQVGGAIIAETGGDMSQFATVRLLASWAEGCPGRPCVICRPHQERQGLWQPASRRRPRPGRLRRGADQGNLLAGPLRTTHRPPRPVEGLVADTV